VGADAEGTVRDGEVALLVTVHRYVQSIMRKIPCALVLLLVCVCIQSAKAADIIVNPSLKSADDANPATDDRPLKTISAAASRARAGDTVIIHAGVYREAVTIKSSGTPDKPIRFTTAPGDTVVVTGADRLTQWKKESPDENLFSTPWPHSFINWNKSHAHPDDDRHRLIGRAEQVFVHGYALRQVLAKEHLARGTFWVDLDNKRLWARSADDADLSKSSAQVEASVRPVVWDCTGAHVQTHGLTFRYAASMAQRGMAQFAGAGDVVEDCVFEFANSAGATFTAPHVTVRRCLFRENGQLGFGASGAHGLTLTDCTVRGNNAKNFDRGWEAGGTKICASRDVVIDHCTFAENRGTGVWFDIGNEHCTVRDCLIERNEDGGIFYEISYALHAHDNVIAANGLADTPGAWATWAGICLSSSPQCLIERNLIIGNKEGLAFREQTRTTPRIDDPKEQPVWNHDTTVRNNTFAWNRDAQVAGWFDTKDQRHWPLAMQQNTTTAAAPAHDLAKPYLAKSPTDGPTHLSLESLHLNLTANLFATRPGQPLYVWGPTWTRHKTYTSLQDIQHDLSLEQASRLTPLPFPNPAAHDYRLPAADAARKNLPQHPIPDSQLTTDN
jgi:hypothetical protein